ncbi:MAG: hypothetical protein ABW154_12380 [Dyella sp.]
MNPFDDDYDHDDADDGEERSVETLVWQLLQLINPGDEDTALQQFDAYREAVAGREPDEFEPVEVIGQVIDWRSGFYIAPGDTRALVQAIDELVARWNLDIDWDGDPDDDEFHDDIDEASLLGLAYDRLAEHGYTLWVWETGDAAAAGWITLKRDGESMRQLATALGINLRLGSEVS